MACNMEEDRQMQFEQQEELEIDIRELFFELLGHWKALVASTAIVAAVALAVSKFILVPQYQSTAALYVLSDTITSLADIQIGTSLTYDYMVVVEGRPVLDQVIENLELDEDYVSLNRKVHLNNPSDSRILEITATDESPAHAKEIADEVAEVASDYIALKMDQPAPTILQYGYADGKPVSPNAVRNTAIGALAGFLSAAVIVAASCLLNDTIMTADDVEGKLGLNFLGALPEVEREDDGEAVQKKRKKKKKGERPGSASPKKRAKKHA